MTYRDKDFSLELATLIAIVGRAPDIKYGGSDPVCVWLSPNDSRMKHCLRVDYWSDHTGWPRNSWTLSLGVTMTIILAQPGFDDVIKRLTDDPDLVKSYAEKPL